MAAVTAMKGDSGRVGISCADTEFRSVTPTVKLCVPSVDIWIFGK